MRGGGYSQNDNEKPAPSKKGEGGLTLHFIIGRGGKRSELERGNSLALGREEQASQ